MQPPDLGRSVWSQETTSVPQHGWSLPAGSYASSWANMQRGSQHSRVALSDLARASSERRAVRSMVRRRWQCRHAHCRMSGTHMWGQQCRPQRLLQHPFRGNHVEKGIHTARGLQKRFTTFSCMVWTEVMCCSRRLLVRDWLLGPPCSAVLKTSSGGSGLLHG